MRDSREGSCTKERRPREPDIWAQLLSAAAFVMIGGAVACSAAPTVPTAPPMASIEVSRHTAPTPTPTPTILRPSVGAVPSSTSGLRPYDVFVPSSYDGSEPMPLVMLLHWLGATGDQVEAEYELEPLAEEQGFLYVHPNGTKNSWGALSWNATDACCNSSTPPVDDSAYLASVIDEIRADYNVDPGVFVFGVSNGGFMAYRMACDHADQISAVVSVVGAMFADPTLCQPTRAVSVLEIHGTADDSVPYEGGQFEPGHRFPGSEATVTDWAILNGCDQVRQLTGERLDLESGLRGAETRVSRFDRCPAGVGVELWVVEGGSHELRITPDFVPEALEFLFAHPRA
ncbi:MAG TPA: alpha/beta fold hydrolase [Candidatus Limnocylindrales bacterium]